MRQTINLHPTRHAAEIEYLHAVRDTLPPGTSWAVVLTEVVRQAMGQGGADSTIHQKLDMLLSAVEGMTLVTLPQSVNALELASLIEEAPRQDDLADDAFDLEGFG